MPLSEENSVLSAFRGLPYTHKTSIDRSTKGKPESSASLVDKFLLKLKIKEENPVKIISASWNDCLPKRFAGRSSPLNVRMNILYVEAENPSVKQEMMFSEREILKKVKLLKGCANIKKIRFL